MKFLLLAAMIFGSMSFVNPGPTSTHRVISPAFETKFVLTHGMGKKLKTDAYFYVGNQSIWTLDYRNGSKISYKILAGSSGDPLCGIEARDSNGDQCEICIKNDGGTATVEFKYKKGTLRYTGYYSK